MRIYRWELLVLCHYADKSCDQSCDKHCDGGDIMFLVCHVTSREHMFKELCELSRDLTKPRD